MQSKFISYIVELMHKQRSSLKSRVTFATLCIFLSGIWIISIYSTYSLRQDLEKEFGAQQLSAATIISSQISALIDTRFNSLEHAASLVNPEMMADSMSIQLFLDNRYDLQLFFRKGHFIVAPDGVSRAFSPYAEGTTGINYSDRDYIATALTGMPTIGIPVMGKITKVPIVGLAVPIKKDNKTIGAIAGVIDLSTTDFLGGISYSSYGRTSDFLVIDKKSRTVVASSDISKILEKLPPLGVNPAIDKFIAGYEGILPLKNTAGVEVVAAAAHIYSADWTMIISMPKSEVYAPITTLQQHILWLTILLSGIAVIVTWWMLTTQLKPLALVVDAISSMTAESMAPLPAVDGSYEIDSVSRVFNNLLEKALDRDAKLNSAKEQYDILVSRIPIGVYILRVAVTGEYSFDYVSPRFAAMFKVSPEVMKNSPYLAIESVHPDERDEFIALNSKAQTLLEAFEWEGRVIIAGEIRWMRFYSTPHLLASGDSIWHGILADITDRRIVEDSLNTNLQRLRDAQSYAHIGWWELDADGQTGVWSPEIYRIMGMDPSIPAGPQTLLKVINNDDADPTVCSIHSCLRDGTEHQVEYRITRPDDGRQRWIDCRARAVRNTSGKIIKIAGFIQDITERKLLEDQVATLANHDPLSGLPNRRMFTDRLSYVMAISRRTKHYGALMFIDLDNFKTVNDSYGHQAGDQVIVEAASRIMSCVRETDTVSRFGGDEFVILLTDLGLDRGDAEIQATRLAEEIRVLLGRPYLLLDATVQHRCTASVGVVVFVNGSETEESLIAKADTAMYHAKEDGRNSIHLAPPPNPQESATSTTPESDLSA